MTRTVCMLVTNCVANDPRVRREAAALRKSGVDVVLVGVNSDERADDRVVEGCHVVIVAHPRRYVAKIRSWWAAVREIVPGKKGQHPDSGKPDSTTENVGNGFVRLLRDGVNILNVLWLNAALARTAVAQSAGIYHCHDLDTLLAGCLAKLLTGGKVVYDCHELFTEQYRPGAKTWLWKGFYSGLERWLIRYTDLRLAVCDSIGKWMSLEYRTAPSVTVRNCPHLQPSPESPSRPAGEKIILYHGAFLPDRGIEQLIASARYLSRAKIVLRGLGPLETHLRALVGRHGLQDLISFAPPVAVSELVTAAAAADIGVVLYLPVCLNARFSLPNKLFEYMMAGLAIVGSDLPELRRIIRDSVYPVGAVCDPHDPQDLARAINELVKDDQLLARLKHNAREAAVSLFNWETESRRLLSAYDSLIVKSRTPSCVP
ncbi:MAG TPA: glycosyltransferase [Nitrospira sp.]|nr:glycosyltransferase [Nitrospira sp.]